MDEKYLAEQCGKGNNRARKELYDVYGGQLMAICLRYAGDKNLARDILHDGFLQIYRLIPDFEYRGIGSLQAWLCKVMTTAAIIFVKKENMFKQNELPLTDISEKPEEEDVNTIPQDVLMEYIRELPDGYRTVFNLYVFEEMGHKEISKILGISERTSSSQYYHARVILMKKINEYRNKNR